MRSSDPSTVRQTRPDVRLRKPDPAGFEYRVTREMAAHPHATEMKEIEIDFYRASGGTTDEAMSNSSLFPLPVPSLVGV